MIKSTYLTARSIAVPEKDAEVTDGAPDNDGDPESDGDPV